MGLRNLSAIDKKKTIKQFFSIVDFLGPANNRIQSAKGYYAGFLLMPEERIYKRKEF